MILMWFLYLLALLVTHSQPVAGEDETSSFTTTTSSRSSSQTVPNYWGCQNDIARDLPYCDASLSHMERAMDLMSRLTLDEKIAAMTPQAKLGNLCECSTSNIDRVGLPEYLYLVEANT